MIRYIKYYLLATFMVVLAGCGGTSTPADGGSSSGGTSVATPYSLQMDSEVEVSQSMQNLQFEIYLKDESGTYAKPVTEKEIEIGFINPEYGSLDSYTATTDSSGKAVFDYTSPSSITNLNDYNVTVVVPSLNVQDDFVLSFKSTEVDRLEALFLTPDSATIKTGSTEVDFDIVTASAGGIGIPSDISIPSVIDGEPGDFGYFKQNSITSNESGQATITYVSPSNIASLNGETKTVTITAEKDGDSVTHDITLMFQTESNTTATDYEISLDTPDSIQVDDEASVTVKILEEGTSSSTIASDDVHEVNMSILTPAYLDFTDNATPDSVTFSGNEAVASKSVSLSTSHYSGVANIEVTARIFNGEKDVTITDSFPLTILSRPIASMSLNYVETNFEDGLYTDIYNLHAVDKYGNPANKGETIYAGVINGVTQSGTAGKYLAKEKAVTVQKNTSDVTEIISTDTDIEFDNVLPTFRQNGHRVITMANADNYRPNVLGGWVINQVPDDTTLQLEEKLFLDNGRVSEDDLSVIIGNEVRYDICEKTVKTADLDSNDGQYVIGDNGEAKLKLKYDPYLVGKDVYMYVNSYTSNSRVGVSLRKKLWGQGVEGSGFSCPQGDACSGVVSLAQNAAASEGVKNVLAGIEVDGPCVINTPAADIGKTGCSGSVGVSVTNNGSQTCSVSWDGSIMYEYDLSSGEENIDNY